MRHNRPLALQPGAIRSGIVGDSPAGPVAPLRQRIEIPVRAPSPDAAERGRLRARGQYLARQEAWDELAREMCTAEAEGQLTTGLSPVARQLAHGARFDVVTTARAAAGRGDPRTAATILRAFEASLADEDPDHAPALTYVNAMAHVDVALTWRGASPPSHLSRQRRTAYSYHMRAARALTDRFEPFALGSACWAALRCAVLEADSNPNARLADDYDDLIELEPRVPAYMRALGRDARPQRFGTWDVLDTEARRVAVQTADVWGVAGYAWVYLGALEHDLGAFGRLDADLFSEGLHDILQRHPTQDMANRLAAFTGLTVGGPSEAGSPRRRVADAFGWITQDHLRELHPSIWAKARTPGRKLPRETSADLVKRGRVRAISTLAEFYAPALDAGRRLVFSAEGVRMLKGD